MPKLLNDEQKQWQVDVSWKMLVLLEVTLFKWQTGYESWVFQHKAESKRQMMFIVIFNKHGVIHNKFVLQGEHQYTILQSLSTFTEPSNGNDQRLQTAPSCTMTLLKPTPPSLWPRI